MTKLLRWFLLGSIVSFWCFVMPTTARAASLYLSPASAQVGKGSTFTVSVKTNTEGQAINTAEATVTFNPDILELVRVSAGSTFTLQSPGSPSKSATQAFFSAGIPNPGYTGGAGTLGSMTFRAKAESVTHINITSGKVLLNDGAGTNALNGSVGAIITITPEQAPPQSNDGLSIASATHPNQDLWYSSTTTRVSWNRPNGMYGYSFIIDQSSATIPDDTMDTTITTTKIYTNLTDGTWYFHIKGRGRTGPFGQTFHYTFHTDTEGPLPFTITLPGQQNIQELSATPTFSFEAKDEISGISHYEIALDSKIIEEKAVSPYTFTSISPGSHTITITAFDKAGNNRRSELSITVAAGKTSVTSGLSQLLSVSPWIVIVLLGLNLLVLLLILIVLWLLYRTRKANLEPSDPVAALQLQVDASLDKLKDHIDAELHKLSKRYAIAAEEDFDQDIAKTKTNIDKQISKLRKK